MKTIKLNNVYITDTYTVCGKLEALGPIGTFFDKKYDDNYCNAKTYEHAEQQLLRDAINGVLEKCELKPKDIDIAAGGDILNQITSCNYVMREFDISFIGTFGACSASGLSLITASLLVEGGQAQYGLSFSSSHNNTAERQFRYPNEYGVQKRVTTTFTATGAGAVIISNKPSQIRVSAITFGHVIDYGLNDPSDMGSAMTPAAYDTFKRHFQDLNLQPSYYDLILTGDLSLLGHRLFKRMAINDGFILENYNDCGLILYNLDSQHVYLGGSGCACSALVSFGYIYKLMKKGRYKRVLIIATGALLSPTLLNQKETIPCIAHAFSLEVVE